MWRVTDIQVERLRNLLDHPVVLFERVRKDMSIVRRAPLEGAKSVDQLNVLLKW